MLLAFSTILYWQGKALSSDSLVAGTSYHPEETIVACMCIIWVDDGICFRLSVILRQSMLSHAWVHVECHNTTCRKTLFGVHAQVQYNGICVYIYIYVYIHSVTCTYKTNLFVKARQRDRDAERPFVCDALSKNSAILIQDSHGFVKDTISKQCKTQHVLASRRSTP